ncbi:murein biosynthesis integral membrane protein MurJ [Heliorestis convoluta]|uniref:Probable lipid II flippase MurJ n=1 Tax=Heliorestis convoluta TaxID=356322 RepID=A0A5Q2N3M8_9FIRM|nr:murein biosynthesis integral membrane protein MurJ [Heliorestis convoluta]QGG47912.1 murein biosynthesis integral membrane protein MurJ [Heliorestis convoluta]
MSDRPEDQNQSPEIIEKDEKKTPSIGGQQVATAAASIMIAMLISRVLGFVREAAIGAKFGQNEVTDAYIAAFTLPDFLYFLLVGGALSTAFIPVFSSYIATKNDKEAWHVASSFINAMILLISVGVVLGIIFTPYLIPLVAYDFKGETLEQAIFLTRIMFPSVLFTSLAGLAMGVLNSHRHFLMPALGSVVYNVVIILCGLLLADAYGIAAFSIGVVLGALANFLVQVPMLRKVGFRYSFTLDLSHPGVRRIGQLMIPAIIGLSVVQFQEIITQNLASALEAGSITALRFANRLMQLPLGVFAIAISVAIFPTLTHCAARKEWTDFRQNLSLGLRSVIFITLPAAVGMAVLRVPVVQVLFEHGKFDHLATLTTASVLLFFLIGLFAQGANQLLPRVFYALQRPQIPVRISAVVLVVNTILSLLLIPYMGAQGLALAFSISAFVAFSLFLLLTRKALGSIDGKALLLSIAKSAFASAVMALVLKGLLLYLPYWIDTSTKTGQIGFLAVAVTIGALVYGLLALAMKMEEARLLWTTFMGRFGRLFSRS